MKKVWGLLASASLLSVPAIAMAAPTLNDVLGASEITAAGYVDASYEAGFNKGSGDGSLAYHTFDTNNNSFELNQAALTLSYLPTSGFGALVNVIAGNDASVINSSYGTGGSDFALTQAYAQWASGPFTVIGGRFVTLAGEEVIDDTKNANVSRSLLFTLAEPLVHTGVRGSMKITDTVTGYLGLSNSAVSGAAADSDKHKTAEGGVAYAPNANISLAATDYYGVDGSSKTNYLDGVASFQVTPALLLAANADYFRAVGGGVDAYVAGLALYGTYQITDAFKASVRAEYLKSRDDVLSPTSADDKANLEEVTLTGDYSVTKSFDLLGEFRCDLSNDKVYPDPDVAAGDGSKNQPEILVKAIYKFGTPTPTT